METVHKYEVLAKATRVRSGVVGSDSIAQPIHFSAPPEFAGEPRVWTPEHFFVASVVTCFVSTFSSLASLMKFSFVSLAVEAEGTLEKEVAGWKFTGIKLRPVLKVSEGKDSERGAWLLNKAEQTCLIARSVNAEISLEPTIECVCERPLAELAV